MPASDNMDASGQQVRFSADTLLDSTHIEFRSHFRRFVLSRLAEPAARGERERVFPREVYALLRDAGFLAPNYPEATSCRPVFTTKS